MKEGHSASLGFYRKRINIRNLFFENLQSIFLKVSERFRPLSVKRKCSTLRGSRFCFRIRRFLTHFRIISFCYRRFQWLCGLRGRFAVACLLGLLVRIPPGAWIFVSDECCLLSGRGPRFGLYLIPCKFNFPNCKYFLEESNFALTLLIYIKRNVVTVETNFEE